MLLLAMEAAIQMMPNAKREATLPRQKKLVRLSYQAEPLLRGLLPKSRTLPRATAVGKKTPEAL